MPLVSSVALLRYWLTSFFEKNDKAVFIMHCSISYAFNWRHVIACIYTLFAGHTDIELIHMYIYLVELKCFVLYWWLVMVLSWRGI